MILTRQIVIAKIQDFLEGRLPGEELHQWAFSQALSDDYSSLSSEDPLLGKIVSQIFGLKMTTVKDRKLVKTLRYFQKCLSGKSALQFVDRQGASLDAQSTGDYLFILRVYVVVFAVAALILQLFPIVKIAIGLSVDVSLQAWADAVTQFMPHLAYSILLMLSLNRTARGWRFYPMAVVFAAGAAYYGLTTVRLVTQMQIHQGFVLAFLPFGALPAALALMLLIIRKVELIRYDRQHKVCLR